MQVSRGWCWIAVAATIISMRHRAELFLGADWGELAAGDKAGFEAVFGKL